MNFKFDRLTEFRHLLTADDLIHAIERTTLGDFELLDEQRLFHVVNADHLRVSSGQDTGAVGGVAEGSKKTFALLKVDKRESNITSETKKRSKK